MAGQYDNSICRAGPPGYTKKIHRLAESIPWNRFLDSINDYKFGLWYMKNSCFTGEFAWIAVPLLLALLYSILWGFVFHLFAKLRRNSSPAIYTLES
jgi:hypothetical protein